MRFTLDELVHREPNYAIVDELDSILIDEARTPLIISGPADESNELYQKLDRVIPKPKPAATNREGKVSGSGAGGDHRGGQALGDGGGGRRRLHRRREGQGHRADGAGHPDLRAAPRYRQS